MQGNKITIKAPKPVQQKSTEAVAEKRIIRIADTDIDGSKKIRDALRLINGISFAYANAVINVLGVDGNKKLQDFDSTTIEKLKEILYDPHKNGIPEWMYNWRRDENTGANSHIIGNDLKSKQTLHIQLIKASRSYRGYRHSFNYKLRGQRVKSRGANFKGRVGNAIGVTKKTALQQQQAAQETKK
jgi:small subunit ribosomal protein S13